MVTFRRRRELVRQQPGAAGPGPGLGSVGRRVQSAIYRNGALGVPMPTPRGVDALEAAAVGAMSRRAYAYVAGSAGVEKTAQANRAAFDQWQLVPRMLRDVEQRDLSVELFGRRHRTPFIVAPVGVQELVHPEADVATARAAAQLDIPMLFSTQASRSMEQCAAVMGEASRWFQLYWSSEDDLVVSFLERAEACGCEALVVTLDTHVLGWRPRDLDLAFLPFAYGLGLAQYTADPVFRRLVEARIAQTARTESRPKPTRAAVRTLLSMTRSYPGPFLGNLRSPTPRAAVETFLDVFSRSSLTWDDLAFLREHTRLPILLKGIQDPDDASRAMDAGVDGLIVSNHGGRQVDGAVGALTVLPEIVQRVGGAIPVLFDSGVRTGADAFKALALGAVAVGIGRPYLYGLAVDGQAGVEAVFDHLAAELDLTMALVGARSIPEIDAAMLRARSAGE